MTQAEPGSPIAAAEQVCRRSAGAREAIVAPRLTKNATESSQADDLDESPSCASESDGVAGTCRQCSALEVALVRRLIGSGRTDDARNLLENLKSSTDASSEIELLLGELLLAEGKVSDATACFLGMLADNPNCVSALKAVAQLHKRSGDLERAAEVRRRGVHGSCLKPSLLRGDRHATINMMLYSATSVWLPAGCSQAVHHSLGPARGFVRILCRGHGRSGDVPTVTRGPQQICGALL